MERKGNTKIMSVSMNEEQIRQLQDLVDTTGMFASELIQEMVQKVYQDPVEVEILMQNFIKKNGSKCSKNRLLRIMSITKKRKALAAQRASAGQRIKESRSISQIQDSIHQEWWKEYCVETIKEGKIPTMELFNLWKVNNAARLGMEAAAELEAVL